MVVVRVAWVERVGDKPTARIMNPTPTELFRWLLNGPANEPKADPGPEVA
jgi:hypothetical protein